MSDVPAGWQPDAENPGGLRWWDGTQWTEHRAPAAPQTPPKRQTRKVLLLVGAAVVVLIIVIAAVSGSGDGSGTQIEVTDYAALASVTVQVNPDFSCSPGDVDFITRQINNHASGLPDDLKSQFLQVVDDLEQADRDCSSGNGDSAADLRRIEDDLDAAETALDTRCHHGSGDPHTFKVSCS